MNFDINASFLYSKQALTSTDHDIRIFKVKKKKALVGILYLKKARYSLSEISNIVKLLKSTIQSSINKMVCTDSPLPKNHWDQPEDQ
jgi:hypothetical protein